MPSAPTQDVIDAASPFLEAQGIPGDLAPLVWQALDNAGLTVVEKASGDPAEAVDSTTVERVRLDGMVGAFMLGIAVGTKGWMVAIEQTDKNGVTTRSAWSFVAGSGDLLD